MALVIFRSDWSGEYVVLTKRELSGDLLVHPIHGDPDHFMVDQSDTWLFNWEKNDPECYARKMQRAGKIKRRERR